MIVVGVLVLSLALIWRADAIAAALNLNRRDRRGRTMTARDGHETVIYVRERGEHAWKGQAIVREGERFTPRAGWEMRLVSRDALGREREILYQSPSGHIFNVQATTVDTFLPRRR